VLKHRLILGAVLIATLVGLIWFDSTLERGWVIAGAALLAALAGGVELAALWRGIGHPADGWWTALCAGAGFVGVAGVALWDGAPTGLAASGCAGALLASAVWYARKKRVEDIGGGTAGASLAAVYVGALLASAVLMREDFGAWAVLASLAVIKSCDIGAYFVGMNFGKRKLIPWLSPGKTWEGLFGGLATAAAVGAAFSFGAEWLHWGWGAVLGVVIGLAGQGGDLFESALKRGAGVKDSGRVPGFGGVLDLLDSPLVGLPVALWLLRLASEVA
jgi:phosphatidate cytidylyltransferase